MNITICGSITFLEEMLEIKKKLLKLGFKEIFHPIGFDSTVSETKKLKDKMTVEEDGKRKIKLDLINEHYKKILKSDCILVVNHEKRGIKGYIGGNTLIELGFAYVNGKPIFLLNDVPDMQYTPEIIGMKPIVIHSKLSNIKKYYSLN